MFTNPNPAPTIAKVAINQAEIGDEGGTGLDCNVDRALQARAGVAKGTAFTVDCSDIIIPKTWSVKNTIAVNG